VPDDIFLKNGFVFWIEFKATGAKPTKNQLEEIATIRKHGGIVYVVDNITFGTEILLRMESLA
jgi:O-acetylhomoserine/O-acetylserine sulfhydrylase-like pyridoxal-dependent enzyme